MYPRSFRTICLFVATAVTVIVVQGCRNQSANNKQADAGKTSFQFKEKLSDYGFFKDKLSELHPTLGVIRYELITPLFSDYTVKDRFVALPNETSIKYTTSGVLDFPDATVIIKNFAYNNESDQKIMIETRLLAKDPADSQWKVMNYLWNKEQTDAFKHVVGAKLPITLLNDQGNKISTVYQVPNTNDCKICHINNSILTPIGPKARNLNFVLDGQTNNQLRQWASTGILTGISDTTHIDALPDWKDDKHFSIEQRARAYLDMNCAHCHTKGGDAYNTGLFLEYEQTEKSHLGIFKSPVSAGSGAGGMDYDIVPGDAAHSILAYRMNSTEAGTAMPELARTVVDKEGVKLISEWIESMTN